MKKIMISLLITLFAPAVFAISSNAILALDTEYAFDVLKNPDIKSIVGDALIDEIIANTGTSFPSQVVDGRFLVISGCEPHNCGPNTAMIIIDSKNPKAVLIYRTQYLDPLAPDDKVNHVFLRNEEWVAKVGDESNFPGLKKAIAGL